MKAVSVQAKSVSRTLRPTNGTSSSLKDSNHIASNPTQKSMLSPEDAAKRHRMHA